VNKKVSILIPVYNEGEIILENTKRLIEYMDKLNLKYEVVIVNNGSTDETEAKGYLLQKLYPGKVKFFSLPERGVGLAFRKLVEEARGEYLISMDMDLSVELEFIPECIDYLKHNSVVVGSKQMGEQSRPWYRTLLSNGFITLTRFLLGLDFHDYSMAAKGYHRSYILPYLKNIDHGSSYVIEIIYYLHKAKHSIIEIPVFCRDTRPSKFNLWKEVLYRFKNLIKLWLRERVFSTYLQKNGA